MTALVKSYSSTSSGLPVIANSFGNLGAILESVLATFTQLPGYFVDKTGPWEY